MLRNELLYAHANRVRKDGQGLVWILEHHGERRQLTVTFCDVVGSTTLASQFDPEEWRTIIGAYYDVAGKVTARFEGHIAQYLGDGLLTYFGYPLAHEDDAQRAARASLGIIEAVERLNVTLAERYDISLAVRVGCHTGLVVIGDLVGDTGQGDIILGDTPNVAARLQGIAQPNTLVIGAVTHQLLGDDFAYQSLRTPSLKGITTPQAVFQVLYENTARTRLEALASAELTPLVGRGSELDELQTYWAAAEHGLGRATAIVGEAGIGKSRLVRELTEHAAARSGWFVGCQCSPYHQHTALYPMIDLIERIVLRPGSSDAPEQRLTNLEGFLVQSGIRLDEAVPVLALLLSIPTDGRYEPLQLSAEQQKQRTFEVLLTVLTRRTQQQPVLFVVEDLQWIDASTLEFLATMARQTPNLPILAVFTSRPDAKVVWPKDVDIPSHTLERLSPDAAIEVACHVAQQKSLPTRVIDAVMSKTDGVPLFIEELTKMLLESELLEERDDHYELRGPLPPLAIPNTLQDSLMARLDRLAPVKEVAQLGAALGREFDYRLLKAVCPLDDATLRQGLEQLVSAGFIREKGSPPQATYHFKHALIQDTAYQSLLKSTRQAHHQRIATTLEAEFGDLAKSQPELIAHHFTEAGLSAQALPHWEAAGVRALDRYANQEAANHANRGLALLAALPESHQRDRCELALQLVLARATTPVVGPHAAAPMYSRVRELAQVTGSTAELLPALCGLAYAHIVQGHMEKARALSREFLDLATPLGDPIALSAAHWVVAYTAWWQGDLVEVRDHSRRCLALYDADDHREGIAVYNNNPGIVCGYLDALSSWMLGYPDEATDVMERTLAHAHELGDPYLISVCQLFSAQLAQLRRESGPAFAYAEDALHTAITDDLPAVELWCLLPRGWARAQEGDAAGGQADIQEAMDRRRRMRMGAVWPWYLTLSAEMWGALGQIENGLRATEEALDWVDRNDERLYAPEAHRIRGELLLLDEPRDTRSAEESIRRGFAIAQSQGAKAFELRAATSLARVYLRQRKFREGYELLSPVYGWFTEGFGTADLIEAKALLEELSHHFTPPTITR
ncbi:AAA family ATPase [Mycolicibacterium sp. P1-5]|uniref:ATP-binding protein n=1 Tax=Mycolicibacterium sp. P1-5 TaxID=2024617 RepID=UPI0011EC3B0E|nr:AAA family ATPase [Mycolicibacterium sp. P1-5]KAA0108868.1 hypothetical protein CIW47_12640 [Mycolicibacterium sp. P1-5]